MADNVGNVADFVTQADALLRKNLTFQKRNMGSLIKLFLFPILFFILLGFAQYKANNFLRKSVTKSIKFPPELPPLIQVPAPEFRAVQTGPQPYTDLPDPSCLANSSCPATILFSGLDSNLSQAVSDGLISNYPVNGSFRDINYALANFVLGTDLDPRSVAGSNGMSDGAFIQVSKPIYSVENFPDDAAQIQKASVLLQRGVVGVQAVPLRRDNSSQINDEIYKGYFHADKKAKKINEIMMAYDLSNASKTNFNVKIWYNSSLATREEMDLMGKGAPALRVPRAVNLVTNSYLKHVVGSDTRIPFEFVKEMPTPETRGSMDLSVLLGPILFCYMILLLFPLMLTALVYEKEQRLRIIMKMHGLTDGTYWAVTYAYNFTISFIYVFIFCAMGNIFGFNMFRRTALSIQLVFLIIYINVQVSLAFLLAAVFSNVKTASVVGFILVFASGLLTLIFQNCLLDPSFPRKWITLLELYPGLSLSRGLSDMVEFADRGQFMGTEGMQWGDFGHEDNGMGEVLIIMLVEWFVFLFAAYYIDQVVAAGGGVRRSPLFFLNTFKKKPESPGRNPNSPRKVVLQIEQSDVAKEREMVEKLLLEPDPRYAMVCDDLKKVFPGRDGNPPKYAVNGLSLAIPRGECFGMLGPNGAGKSSFLGMMTGLTEPSSGTAYIQGLDLRTDMNEIYTSMGVCPQHDLLWETLTGREHLLFYGRLKNLKGVALHEAVEESLDSVNLLRGGVADKQAGRYSGGMKRRLSVAISLIGDPKVVYMDEPSTALDPASRNLLWNVVKKAKKDRAIILTTHSMEEAEYLCDRLCIYVSGRLECIGSPNELKGRYGGSYVFTVTTSADHDKDIEMLVQELSPGATKTYHIPGTQKFELPKNEVKLVDVFRAVDNAKRRFAIQAWGVADTTLEDVFIKVALEAQQNAK